MRSSDPSCAGGTVSLLDECSGLFAPELVDLWPLAAVLARATSGRLMGGTALALHLRHRASEDIDVMTFKDFSGVHMRRRMRTYLDEAFPSGHQYEQDVLTSEQGGYYAMIGDVRVDVFRARPTEGRLASQMKWLDRPVVVEGVPVGSVPDILATKLDVIMYRPKLRDYIDIADIDRASGYTLEDGLEFYRHKYGYVDDPDVRILRRIIRLLADPGTVHSDPRFEDRRSDVLDHLERRSHDLIDYVADIADNDTQNRAVRSAGELGAPRPGARPAGQCGAWMPRARACCALPPRHKGGHRRRRSAP